MARLPRLAVAGQPHLVIQRGHGRHPVFVNELDRCLYLYALRETARSGGVAVHAYALLENEVWLLVTPHVGVALGRLMQRIGRRYVAAFNRRHGTRGTLWAGRFHAAPIEPQRYLLSCIRLIEQAPVRAGLAARPHDWPWSSARHHVGQEANSLVTEHAMYWQLGNTPFEREARHDIELQHMLADDQARELLAAAQGGWPLGSDLFVSAIAQTTVRPLRPRPRGRPRTVPQ